MRPSLRYLRRCAAVAGSLMLAAGAGAPLLSSGGEAVLQVDEYTVDGNVLRVVVSNRGDQAASGMVVARLDLATGVFAAASPVTVAEGQKAFVDLVAPSPIDGVIHAGAVLDDGAPF